MQPSILTLAYDGSYVGRLTKRIYIFRLGQSFYQVHPSGAIYPVGPSLVEGLFIYSNT